MRRLVVAVVCTLGFSAAAIAAPATSDAVSRHALIPGHWTGVGPTSKATKVWTFTVPRTGYVLMRSTGATTTDATAPVDLTDAAGRNRIARLRTQSADAPFGNGTYSTAIQRLSAGHYALTGRPLKGESIRVDLIPNAVTVLDSSIARDNDGRTRVIGEIINGTSVTRAGIKLRAVFRDKHGTALGHSTVSPVFDRIPQGGTDLVAALVTPPKETTGITLSLASGGTRTRAVPGGLSTNVDVDIACTAPPDSGLCDAGYALEARVGNVGSAARQGIVVAVASRTSSGAVYEVDLATVPVLASGVSVLWGGVVDPAPWLPLEVRNPKTVTSGDGAMTAFAQASS